MFYKISKNKTVKKEQVVAGVYVKNYDVRDDHFGYIQVAAARLVKSFSLFLCEVDS